MKKYIVGILDIKFYLMDEEGNEIEDKNGNEIEYQFKEGIRYKPLEYLTEGIEPNMLEKIKK